MYSDTVSYSSTGNVIIGPDRFLVLYTDFKHGGGRRKAIVVQEVIVKPKSRREESHRRPYVRHNH